MSTRLQAAKCSVCTSGSQGPSPARSPALASGPLLSPPTVPIWATVVSLCPTPPSFLQTLTLVPTPLSLAPGPSQPVSYFLHPESHLFFLALHQVLVFFCLPNILASPSLLSTGLLIAPASLQISLLLLFCPSVLHTPEDLPRWLVSVPLLKPPVAPCCLRTEARFLP